MTAIINFHEEIKHRDAWTRDPNPLYPMDARELFDIGSDHQTTLVRMKPGAEQHAHYHRLGGDIFVILQGSGTLTTAPLDKEGIPLSENISQPVKPGDIYSIKTMEMHTLLNTGSEDLVWLNIAPSDHNEADLTEV